MLHPLIVVTYFGFHLTFVVPPAVGLTAASLSRPAREGADVPVGGLAAIVVLALLYTTPWDNYLIEQGVWHYGEGVVAGTIWHAPVEEYLFIALQPLVTALWLSRVHDGGDPGPTATVRNRVAGLLAGVAVGGVGAVLLSSDPTFYLGAILLWAAPVLAIQWAFGWPYLWHHRRVVAVGVAVPTLYFWVADRIALAQGIWVISETYTVGVDILGLPVEEALFFLVTNLFIVQGLVLYEWVIERWR
ncbi:lycopene cyclase domain-containing protein [Halostella salina]|uniref:lycopene cyclase domain-containing protein n=1 Tax=Halostella salina TaxID=1547897 RepID=UPI000EF82B8E|nr:lycopene cyclase domain-containing protein [Halostella salina]